MARDPRTDRAFERAALGLVVVAVALPAVWMLSWSSGAVRILGTTVAVVALLNWWLLSYSRRSTLGSKMTFTPKPMRKQPTNKAQWKAIPGSRTSGEMCLYLARATKDG
jgi:hypothetical protein